MEKIYGSAILISASLFMSGYLHSESKEKIVHSIYDSKNKIVLALNMGDCSIKASHDGKIHVDLSYFYECYYEPIMKNCADELLIREVFKSEKRNGGYSHWVLAVPDGTKIQFKSATGGIQIDGASVEISGSTGTGQIDIRKAKGIISISTGTGGVSVEDSGGNIKVATGTGRILVRNSNGQLNVQAGTGEILIEGVTLEGKSYFSSGAEKIHISDLTLNSGTVSVTTQITPLK